MQWMDEAWRQQGVHEIEGPGASPEILRMFAQSGHPQITSDETPWCAAFVGACLEAAGIRSTRSLLARSYLEHGTAIDAPRVGAVAIFRRTSDPSKGHVGFVVGWTETTIALLGGNQANAVNVAHYKRSECIGLRWPAPTVTPADLARDGSRIAQASQRQIADGGKTAVTNLPAGPKIDHEAMVQKMQGVKGAVETLEAFVVFGISKWTWIAGGLAAFWIGRMAYDAWIIRQARAEDHNTGKTFSPGPSDARAAAGPVTDAGHTEVFDHAPAR